MHSTFNIVVSNTQEATARTVPATSAEILHRCVHLRVDYVGIYNVDMVCQQTGVHLLECSSFKTCLWKHLRIPKAVPSRTACRESNMAYKDAFVGVHNGDRYVCAAPASSVS